MKLTDQIFDILGIFKGAKRTVYAREYKQIEKLLESKYKYTRKEIFRRLIDLEGSEYDQIANDLLATKPSKYNRSPKKGNGCFPNQPSVEECLRKTTPIISPKPPMNSLNRDQYKEVDERFDKEFTCIVTYEKWPDEEEQRLREPQYKFKDFPNTNPKMIKSFLHSELEKVRQETIEECVEALPKKIDEDDIFHFGIDEVSPEDSFNQAIDQATQNINNLDKE